MPPAVSGPEDVSDWHSDSSVAQDSDLDDEPRSDAASEINVDFFGSVALVKDEASHHSNHVAGRLPNEAGSLKRKARDSSGSGTQRRKTLRIVSARASTSVPVKVVEDSPPPQSAGTDMSGYGYGNSQSLVAPTAPQPQAQAMLQPASPRTALQLFSQMYPQFPIREMRNKHTKTLANCLVRRVPTVRRPFRTEKALNIPSYFMQATGELLSGEQACGRCQRGSGRYAGCVVVNIPSTLILPRGACANCLYNRHGSICTLRTAGEIHEENRLPNLKPPVVNDVTRTADQTVYAAPKETPIPTRQIPANHITSDVIRHQAGGYNAQQPQKDPQLPQSVTGILPPPVPPPRLAASASPPPENALDTKVRSWESRYRKMSTASLVATQEHLMEWQEDTSTRLVAINRVFMARLKDQEARGDE
ncbi:hypothetical protein B0T24DRAFT_671220 [Lasiosphaeria ovina]|uniref:Uncharacterized protein n=1 Tax=Lasiosphaeria ovina TaxID=92902 RepID=A0AAE0MZN1_9PEZI|nr:hypothetical protein B0T24DRAFT_671220 [Lasiosphaeria ovina]